MAEFQLALEFDEKDFKFGHKLYEIERSPAGPVFGCLLILIKSKVNILDYIPS